MKIFKCDFFTRQTEKSKVQTIGTPQTLLIDNGKQKKKTRDVLFFDWGQQDYDSFHDYRLCCEIIEKAEKNPENLYVMSSPFTSRAMVSALEDEGYISIPNIFFDMEDFYKYYKDHKDQEAKEFISLTDLTSEQIEVMAAVMFPKDFELPGISDSRRRENSYSGVLLPKYKKAVKELIEKGLLNVSTVYEDNKVFLGGLLYNVPFNIKWESGVLNWFKKRLTHMYKPNFLNIQLLKHEDTGTIATPKYGAFPTRKKG